VTDLPVCVVSFGGLVCRLSSTRVCAFLFCCRLVDLCRLLYLVEWTDGQRM